LVETVRENGKTKQRIVHNLGRKEMVEAHGDLDRLVHSAAPYPDFNTFPLGPLLRSAQRIDLT